MKAVPTSRTAEYGIWRHIRRRCHDPRDDSYADYGRRGIKVCQRWRASFAAFLADVGLRPSPKHTLDRHPNNDGDYEPGNVRWATRKQQQEHTRKTRHAVVDGAVTHVAEACRLLGLNENTVRYRLRAGWSVEKALATPIGKHVTLPAADRRAVRRIRGMSQDRIAARFGISQSAVSEIRGGGRR